MGNQIIRIIFQLDLTCCPVRFLSLDCDKLDSLTDLRYLFHLKCALLLYFPLLRYPVAIYLQPFSFLRQNQACEVEGKLPDIMPLSQFLMTHGHLKIIHYFYTAF